jgi:hypothetical protein
MQIAGSGVRVKSAVLRDTLRSAPELRLIWNRYILIQGLQVAQIAACNRLHEIEQRLARWLLMCQDRIDSEILLVTHEFLAQMLGTGAPECKPGSWNSAARRPDRERARRGDNSKPPGAGSCSLRVLFCDAAFRRRLECAMTIFR